MLHEDDGRPRVPGLAGDLVDPPDGSGAIKGRIPAFTKTLLDVDDKYGGIQVGDSISTLPTILPASWPAAYAFDL